MRELPPKYRVAKNSTFDTTLELMCYLDPTVNNIFTNLLKQKYTEIRDERCEAGSSVHVEIYSNDGITTSKTERD